MKLPDTMERGQLVGPVIDEMFTPARKFVSGVTDFLKKSKQKVEMCDSFFLNSTDHPFKVPAVIDGIKVRWNFEALMPVWALEPKGRCLIVIEGARGARFWQRGDNTYDVHKAALRILQELQSAKRGNERNVKAQMAQANFDTLRETLGVDGEGLEIRKGNYRIQKSPKAHTRVLVTLSVSHEEAAEIVGKYGKGK